MKRIIYRHLAFIMGMLCLICSSPCVAGELTPIDAFADEKQIAEACAGNPSPECIEHLAQVRFDYAREIYAYLIKTDNLDSLELAIAYAESAVELAPQNSLYWSHLGEFYSLLPGNEFASMAEGAYLHAIETNPNNHAARFSLAKLLFSEGRHWAAAQQMIEAFERDPATISQETAEFLALTYLLDDNAAAGLETFQKLSESYDKSFLKDFQDVFVQHINTPVAIQ